MGSIGNALFIVGTPFQCLCMLEAIDYFNIQDYDVIVNTDKVNRVMIEVLFEHYGISASYSNYKHLLFDIVPLILKKKKHYSNVFVGYYYSKTYFDLAWIHSKFKAKIFVLDDGIQALEIFSYQKRIIKNKLWVDTIQIFFKLIAKIKFVSKESFFTIYDVKSNEYDIIKNPFKKLGVNFSDKVSGAYIVSTNSSVVSFIDNSYEEYLHILISTIKKRYSDEIIYFCPHRRDQNNSKLKVLCEKLGIEWYDTKVSLEFDLVTSHANPRYIVGFTSNALYTLKMIYKEAEIETVMYHLSKRSADLETEEIRKSLNNYGIKTLNLE